MPRQRKLKKQIRASMRPGERYTEARARLLADRPSPPRRPQGGAMYPFERFTEDAKQVLVTAQAVAKAANHTYIGTEHLLLGILQVPGPGLDTLTALGFGLDDARRVIERHAGQGERSRTLIPTSRVKRVIELAFEMARARDRSHVDSGCLLLGLALEGEGIAAKALVDLGATAEAIAVQLGVDAQRLPKGARQVMTAETAWQLGRSSRVLVHDQAPPYRLWEGSVVEVSTLGVKVAWTADVDVEQIVPIERIHGIPPRVDSCAYCEFQPG